MQFQFKKNKLVTGTIILTVAGIITRIIGFFFRIFLSRNIGEEGMGIYQLLAPIMALSFSLTCAGIQTAISKYIAAYEASGNRRNSLFTLFYGIIISVSLSFTVGFILCKFSLPISIHFLAEKRCYNLIRIYALSLPFCAVHSCINGYYFGLKKTAVPSVTQLIEQIVRVLSVCIIFHFASQSSETIKTAYAVFGIVFGEIASSAVSVVFLFRQKLLKQNASCRVISKTIDTGKHVYGTKKRMLFSRLIFLAAPLSINRIVLNMLQSVEAAYLPRKLTEFGLSGSDALSLYGVLTGMALPMILFPQAITNSVSVLLLPYVSEAESQNKNNKISHSICLSTAFCLLLGFGCMSMFYMFGPLIGNLIFKSDEAGLFIRTLSFLCPFLYLGTLTTSILNGLGKANLSFFINIAALTIRLAGVFVFVPHYGIKAYLHLLLLSQIMHCILNFVALKKYLYYNNTWCFQISKLRNLHNIKV